MAPPAPHEDSLGEHGSLCGPMGPMKAHGAPWATWTPWGPMRPPPGPMEVHGPLCAPLRFPAVPISKSERRFPWRCQIMSVPQKRRWRMGISGSTLHKVFSMQPGCNLSSLSTLRCCAHNFAMWAHKCKSHHENRRVKTRSPLRSDAPPLKF